MEDEKLFCDEDLTLNRMADILSLTPHQVSEFLNNVLETNFNSFINSYRIDEAKQLLMEDSERSILSVAYSVGFNSKSVFYNAFTKVTGTSPTKFRKDH